MSGDRRNRQRATATNARAKTISAAISSNTSPNSAPKSMSLLKPVFAQPWGVSFARDCIQAGVMKRGHQQPPIGRHHQRGEYAGRIAAALGLNERGEHYAKAGGDQDY